MKMKCFGMGDKVWFWNDVWLGDKTMSERFNRLSRLGGRLGMQSGGSVCKWLLSIGVVEIDWGGVLFDQVNIFNLWFDTCYYYFKSRCLVLEYWVGRYVNGWVKRERILMR